MTDAATAEKPQAAFEDFARLDMRVGRVVEVTPFPRARNPAYKVAVDLGILGVRWSSAQITSYTAEELLGTEVICICNFAPRNIAGFQSEILILGARNETGDMIVLSPRSAVPLGSPIL
jgi:tRNA-binding protein